MAYEYDGLITMVVVVPVGIKYAEDGHWNGWWIITFTNIKTYLIVLAKKKSKENKVTLKTTDSLMMIG